MDLQELLKQLKSNQFTIVSYYGYDTGYLNSEVLFKAEEPVEDLYSQINRIHTEARKLCGLAPWVDNKSAVQIILKGQSEPLYLCVYDYERTVSSSIVRRFGREFFPLQP